MIDLIKSAGLNGMEPVELYIWLKKYPQSNRKVICYCNDCGKERLLTYDSYHGSCHSCGTIRRYNNPDERMKTGIATRKAIIDDPTILERRGEGISKAHKDNPKLWYAAHEASRGGTDIVTHHIAYDFNNLGALTIKITRSHHGSIHNPKGLPLTERGYSLID